MKKLSVRSIILFLSILNCAAIIAAIACCMPDTVATHFNVKGQADAWGSKWNYIMFAFLPLILSVTYEIYRKKSNNAKGNQALEDKLIPLISVAFIALGWLMIPFSSVDSMNLHAGGGVFMTFGVLMVILSNYMGKIQPNRRLGIRIPWTLNNEIVWRKTHRLAGFTGMAGGFILTAGGAVSMFNSEKAFAIGFCALIPAIILTVLVPIIYSYILYKKIASKEG